MAKRQQFFVSPHADGWQVKRPSAQRASSVHRTQADAVEQATKQAKSVPLGQVIVQGRDGKIRDERTHGKDPFPPPG